MQSYKFDEVIEKAAERKNLDKEMLKSISDFVFTETKAEMGRFSNLRVYLEGLMTFFYGKKRLEELRERVEKREGRTKISFLSRMQEEQQNEILSKVDYLIDELYPTYIKDKNETKAAYKAQEKLKNEPNTEI